MDGINGPSDAANVDGWFPRHAYSEARLAVSASAVRVFVAAFARIRVSGRYSAFWRMRLQRNRTRSANRSHNFLAMRHACQVQSVAAAHAGLPHGMSEALNHKRQDQIGDPSHAPFSRRSR